MRDLYSPVIDDVVGLAGIIWDDDGVVGELICYDTTIILVHLGYINQVVFLRCAHSLLIIKHLCINHWLVLPHHDFFRVYFFRLACRDCVPESQCG